MFNASYIDTGATSTFSPFSQPAFKNSGQLYLPLGVPDRESERCNTLANNSICSSNRRTKSLEDMNQEGSESLILELYSS